ncbi:gamma-secretase-activating protein-like isoform X4 [Oncorhynchus kisutch]|uniref:gamma-secretase-activating protein-like isoform X4 n=1 Tax=Oncorhynchus kisutch TaxID=8019 RepID=UPI0012DDD3DB|nr:gamma-secretase-activating protein-like isoform X4 [Oncorhynchus kisutch]
MLQLSATFDLQQDVVSSIFKKEATVGIIKEYSGIVDTRILNIERDGGVLYSWKGETGTTRIGKYDPNTRQNKLLYTFDKQVCVSSCSLNKEETLLAVSLAQRTRTEERLRPVSKCLTLLIEIHPINNTKVLKAVDCRVRVQFLHPDTERDSVLESHLLLVAEDGYVEQLHVMLVRQEGYRVVMLNPECLAKDRVAEEFSWVQWDSQTQRLFYLTYREKAVLKCVQFCHDRNCETLFELVLELPSNPFSCMRFVNLGFDHQQERQQEREEMRMVVITNNTEGSMCVCYSQPACVNQEITYTIVLVHRGCSKTFSVALDGTPSPCGTDLLPLFIPIGYYVVVYLSGHFLHCINTRQQELLCHSLFLSGVDAELGVLGSDSVVLSLPESSLLDLNTGRMYTVDLNPSFLMDLLHCSHSRPDAQRLAALHCLLLYMGPNAALELKIIDWICDNVMPFDTFDQIQEFILASLYRIIYKKCLSLDEVLPYSSVFEKKKVPEALDQVPGVTCTTELHAEPVFKGKARSLQGYWEELQWSTEKMKYFEAVPNPRYRASQNLPDWTKLLTTLKSKNKKASNYLRHIEENTKQVLSMVDSWNLDQKVVPLFQEEDSQQRALIGLMVDKLREHLNRHLPRLGKKKIDVLVVNYVAKLLELIRRMLESVWLKYKLGPLVLCLKQRGSSAEWAVFHVMCRILEATKTLCLPLPPGYHTLLSVLGVRCLPRHTFLQYVDHGVLQLTETFVSRLMTDLDNSDANEELKFSILKRLPEVKSMEQRICHLWDHPISSACISRDYVRGLLEKHAKTKGSMFMERDEPGFRPEFLPLTFLTKILLDVEDRALNPFEEQENVDARFVEETALKQTLILMGFQDK